MCKNHLVLWLPIPFAIAIPFLGQGWCLGLLFPFSVFIIIGIALWRSIFVCIDRRTCQKSDISLIPSKQGIFLLGLHTLLFFGRYAIDIDDEIRLAPIFMMDIFLIPFYAAGKCIGLGENGWSVFVFGLGGTLMWFVIAAICLRREQYAQKHGD